MMFFGGGTSLNDIHKKMVIHHYGENNSEQGSLDQILVAYTIKKPRILIFLDGS